MRKYLFACLLLLPAAAAASMFSGDDAPPPPACAPGASFDTYFAPHDEVGASVARAIGLAKKSVRVSAHDFTSKPVSEALVNAGRAGVDVKTVLDGKANGGGYSAARFLQRMSYAPRLTRSGMALHSDYIVIDGRDVVVGNIATPEDATEEKQGRAQALVIHNAPDIAKRYLADWQGAWDGAEPMKDK